MADHLAVLNLPIEALKRSHTVTSFDPLTLLPALAVQTSRIGIVANASTTFEEPYILAREIASRNRLNQGRAGWTPTARHGFRCWITDCFSASRRAGSTMASSQTVR